MKKGMRFWRIGMALLLVAVLAGSAEAFTFIRLAPIQYTDINVVISDYATLRNILLNQNIAIGNKEVYWNQRMVTVMMIETPLAMQNVEAIASVPGVDALLVGMRDLALRLGREVDDYTAHLYLKDELLRVVEACQKSNKAAAVLVTTPEELVLRLREGYRLIGANSDLLILAEYWQRMRQVFRGALDEKEARP